MNAVHVERSSAEHEATSDRSWSGLYRAGGISALLFVVLIIVAIVFAFTMPPAPISGGAATLQYIAAHRLVYILEQVLWLAPSVFAMIVFLALPVALNHLNKSFAAIAALVGIASWALTLAWPATGGGAPALVYLSDQYVAATTAAQRATFAAAAEGFIAQKVVPAAMGILEPIGILIVSLLMLKGVFSKGVAYLGIVTGVLGILSESLRPVLGIGYIVYGLLLPIWFLVIGWKLYRLGSRLSREPLAVVS
jgi:hypothetical protein